jgi:prenylcysteine oxidase/farnesylcysteine lyase
MADADTMPDAVLTVEDESIPFSSLGLVSAAPNGSFIYKLFSREEPTEALLDEIFAKRLATEQIRWAAYPVLRPDGALSPFKLGKGLYWANTMEFATSTMETEAVAARNVVNLLVTELNAS